MDSTDVLVVRIERWPRGRRASAELKAVMKIRPKLEDEYEVEISYSNVPTRRRSLHTLRPSRDAKRDLWQLIQEALWPIWPQKEAKGSIIIDVEAVTNA